MGIAGIREKSSRACVKFEALVADEDKMLKS